MNKRKKKFIKLPEYAGGSQALKQFIAKNLVYPKEALENNIEGSVIISYEVDDNGKITNAQVEKSLGYGCDEEALRLVNLLAYDKVKNRGARVKASKKMKINFIRPKKSNVQKVNYIYTPADKSEKKDDKPKGGYSYIIKI